VNWRKLRIFLITALFLCLIPATRYHEVDEPLMRALRGAGHLDPLALQLRGEFVENNLGTEQDADGSVTVRMIAQQYLFIPHCVLVPAGVPVHLRITSADIVHSLRIEGTDYSVKITPGNVSQLQLRFPERGTYPTACGEFCGAGHYTMRSEFRSVPQEQFPALAKNERGNCAAP